MAEIESKLQDLGIEIIEGSIERAEYFSVKEAAQMLNCTTKTIRNRIDRKELKAIYHKIGIGQSQYLIPKAGINVATITTDVVPVSRAVSIGELKESIKAEIREENNILRREISELRMAQKEIVITQDRIENFLKERDEKLMQIIRERQHEQTQKRPWWKVW